MSPLIFDLIVLVLILLSAGLGFLRGFCNEIFTIFGWIGAVVATVLLTAPARVLLKDYIESDILAGLAAASAIFIVTMVLFSIISHYATRSLQAGKLGPVDRTLGFGFGLLRGVLFVGLMYLLILFVFSSDSRLDFIKNARTRPLLEASAELVQFVLPGDVMIDVKPDATADETVDTLGKNAKPQPPVTDADDLDRYKAKEPATAFERQTPDTPDKTAPAKDSTP